MWVASITSGALTTPCSARTRQGSPCSIACTRLPSSTAPPPLCTAAASPSRYLQGLNCAWSSNRTAPATANGSGHSRVKRAGRPSRCAASASCSSPRELRARAAVDVGRRALEVAGDGELVREPQDLLEPGLVRGAVGARSRGAEAGLEPMVDQAVLRGDLGGRAPGDLAPDLPRLEHRDPPPGALQQQRRGQPDDAARRRSRRRPRARPGAPDSASDRPPRVAAQNNSALAANSGTGTPPHRRRPSLNGGGRPKFLGRGTPARSPGPAPRRARPAVARLRPEAPLPAGRASRRLRARGAGLARPRAVSRRSKR